MCMIRLQLCSNFPEKTSCNYKQINDKKSKRPSHNDISKLNITEEYDSIKNELHKQKSKTIADQIWVNSVVNLTSFTSDSEYAEQ